MKNKIDFANELKSLRVSLYVSQAELAAQFHVPPSTYKNWEQGKCLPKPQTLKKLVDFFKTKKRNPEALVKAYEILQKVGTKHA